jgi:hypothetical protein
MHYTFITPPASRAADRPTPIDDALVEEARRVLRAVVESIPHSATLSRRTSQALFAGPMATLCDSVRHCGVPIEKLIIAIKLAWASLAVARLRLGESAPDALAAAVSACIEAYFAAESPRRAD